MVNEIKSGTTELINKGENFLPNAFSGECNSSITAISAAGKTTFYFLKWMISWDSQSLSQFFPVLFLMQEAFKRTWNERNKQRIMSCFKQRPK